MLYSTTVNSSSPFLYPMGFFISVQAKKTKANFMDQVPKFHVTSFEEKDLKWMQQA